jgi:hypothetical protein
MIVIQQNELIVITFIDCNDQSSRPIPAHMGFSADLKACMLAIWMEMIESVSTCSWYLLLVVVVSVPLQYCVSVFADGFVQTWCGTGLNFRFQHVEDGRCVRWRASKQSIITSHCGSTSIQSKGCSLYEISEPTRTRGTPLGEVVYSRLKSLPCTEIPDAA